MKPMIIAIIDSPDKIDRAPRREVVREHSPRTPAAIDIKNAIKNLSHLDFTRAAPGFGRRNQGFNHMPFSITQITRIGPSNHQVQSPHKKVDRVPPVVLLS